MSVGLLKQNGRTVLRYDVPDVDGSWTYALRSKPFKLWIPLLISMLQCCLAICFVLIGRKVNTFSQIHKNKFSRGDKKYYISYQNFQNMNYEWKNTRIVQYVRLLSRRNRWSWRFHRRIHNRVDCWRDECCQSSCRWNDGNGRKSKLRFDYQRYSCRVQCRRLLYYHGNYYPGDKVEYNLWSDQIQFRHFTESSISLIYCTFISQLQNPAK